MYKKRSLLLDLVEEIRQIVKTKAYSSGCRENFRNFSLSGGQCSLDFSVKVWLLSSIVLTSSGLTEDNPVRVLSRFSCVSPVTLWAGV